MQKTAQENTKYWTNRTILKIGHRARAIAHAKPIVFEKWSVWSKIKNAKNMRKTLNNNISVDLWKKGSKKDQILEKWDNFENGPSCKGYSPCKANSLCKIVSLSKNLKMPKTWKNHSTVTLELFCEKNRSKKHQILEKEDDLKNRPSCKGYSPCKG